MPKVQPNKKSVKPQNHERKYHGQPSHALPIWNGILEHREKIGPAIWEFLWCIDKITVEDEIGIGWLLGKTPIDTKRIADDLNECADTAYDNMERLAVEGYIIRKRTPRGYSIGVVNSRKFSARQKSDSEKIPNHRNSDSDETPNHDSEKTPNQSASDSEKNPNHNAKVIRTFPESDSEKTPSRRDFTETIQNVQGDVAVETDFAGRDSHSLSPQSSTERERELKKWATTIILNRAPTTILNKQAYLKTCLTEFFQNLPAEIESYLTDQAKSNVERALWDAPDLPIGFLEITNFLDSLRDEHDLPLNLDDPLILDRILDGVKEANADTLLVVEPCGFFPSPKWQTQRHGFSRAIPGWQEYRTSISGYIPSSPGLGTLLWSRPAKISAMAEMLNTLPDDSPTQ